MTALAGCWRSDAFDVIELNGDGHARPECHSGNDADQSWGGIRFNGHIEETFLDTFANSGLKTMA